MWKKKDPEESTPGVNIPVYNHRRIFEIYYNNIVDKIGPKMATTYGYMYLNHIIYGCKYSHLDEVIKMKPNNI